MAIHIGKNTAVREESLIAIIPRETAMASRDTRRAIDNALGRSRMDQSAGEAHKSYLIAEREGRTQVYASPIASTTLQKRAEQFRKDFQR